MIKPRVVLGESFGQTNLIRGHRILLLSPPIYDYRLDWPQWHLPIGLLQVATWLRKRGKEVRLIDCLAFPRGNRVPRSKLGTEVIEGYQIHKWHFGLGYEQLRIGLETLVADNWIPHSVFITTLNSAWWESARDSIRCIRECLPKTKIILGGAYPSLFPEHAARLSRADAIVVGAVPEVARLSPDLTLYDPQRYSTGLHFYPSAPTYKSRRRSTKTLLREIQQGSQAGVREFVFFDEEIKASDRDVFGDLLGRIARLQTDAHFVLPGNILPDLVTRGLARKLQRAHVTQVYLRCAVDVGLDKPTYTTSLDQYKRCIEALVEAGDYEPRAGNIAAMLVIGLPYEDLDVVSERLIQLAHIAGSVILVPFQYVPGLHSGPLFTRALTQNGRLAPEKLSSRLFTIARLSGKTLEDYMELTRLAALVNSKYRSKTFDFLGEGLAARLLRESLRTHGWNPFPNQSAEDATSDTLPKIEFERRGK